MSKFKGATVSIQWLDDKTTIDGYYIQFGEAPIENDAIDDGHVFYYCDNEDDLKALMQKSNCLDFVVLSYDLVEA